MCRGTPGRVGNAAPIQRRGCFPPLPGRSPDRGAAPGVAATAAADGPAGWSSFHLHMVKWRLVAPRSARHTRQALGGDVALRRSASGRVCSWCRMVNTMSVRRSSSSPVDHSGALMPPLDSRELGQPPRGRDTVRPDRGRGDRRSRGGGGSREGPHDGGLAGLLGVLAAGLLCVPGSLSHHADLHVLRWTSRDGLVGARGHGRFGGSAECRPRAGALIQRIDEDDAGCNAPRTRASRCRRGDGVRYREGGRGIPGAVSR